MGFLYGFIGAFLGAALGGATAFFFVSSTVDGDELGIDLLMMLWGPVSLIIGGVIGVLLALRVLRYVQRNQQGKYAKRNNALLASGCVLAVSVLAAVMIWKGNQCQYPPSDRQLINNFRLHRVQLDELAQMRRTDKGLMQVGEDWTQPSDSKTVGVSPERIANYRWLLSCAGVHRGLGADGLYGTDFTYWAQGGATSDDVEKGYAYLLITPKQATSSLDRVSPDGLHELEVYRHIEGCWYLYYDYLPG